MNLKVLFLPMLVVVASLFWAFKPYEAANKVIRTKEGAYIIPSTVKISPEDQKSLFTALRKQEQPLGALAYYQNGKLKTYGNYNLGNFRQIGKSVGASMEPQAGTVTGFILVKKKLIRSKTKDDNKFSESTILDEKAWVTIGGIQATGTAVDDVLGRYAD